MLFVCYNTIMNIAGNLNDAQKKAVQFGKGPLLIVAGAGTGKTTVITQRLAWLIIEQKISTDNILALTFTEKAAGEMEERVDVLLPYGYVDLWVSTFHAFCDRILGDNALEIGLPPDYTLLDETEQMLLVRQNFDAFDLDYYRPLGNPTKFIQALVRHFSRVKDEGIMPDEYIEYAKKIQLDRDDDKFLKKKGDDDDEISEDQRMIEVANAYHTYQQLLLDKSALDFGDLILYTIKLFKTRPRILKKYQGQFKYILVDEFQDTNYAQYELVKMLAAPTNNVTVVGDDDQCLPGNSTIQLEQGLRRIDRVEKGDRVLTAVGKGHIGVSRVARVMKNTKHAKLVTLTTTSGKRITATANHKFFCYVPRKDTQHVCYYVYLMYRTGFGWRIGITNDIASRLRLERSADYIIGISAYTTEQEARYWEVYYALRYGIPSVCFQKRDGAAITDSWLEKLYHEIDTEQAVRHLAADLDIDLEAYHYALQGVKRGGKSRVKIYLDMCYRKYRSKDHVKNKRPVMKYPAIAHAVTIETSDTFILQKIKQAGYQLTPSKKGYRLRIQTSDIRKAGQICNTLRRITGGIVENRFTAGRIEYQHRPALVMPAGNVLPGHFIPVKCGHNIEYERVIKKSEHKKKQAVYDLEIERTHNYIADDVVVHNSIYKFRGAAISNILEFKKDFPQSREIVLTENYRTKQNILDMAYKFIKQNDPNRLEYQLSNGQIGDKGAPLESKISKKLQSHVGDEGIIHHLHFKSHTEETAGVVKKIIELKKKDKKLLWSDFAILVRANNYAQEFITALSRYDIPHHFLASSGLYYQPEIMDVVSYLKMLDNYHESPALWRVLNLPHWNMPADGLMRLSNYARRKSMSLWEAVQQSRAIPGLPQEMHQALDKIRSMIEKHTQLARAKGALPLALRFMKDSGYLKHITQKDTPENFEKIIHLNQFFREIEQFEAVEEDATVKHFLYQLDQAKAAGERGSLRQQMEEGPEAVRIMTVHGAKGLEFPYVFIVSLVDKRFPSIKRKEPIALPDELVKEIIPEGDIHLEEERRLFYVAMTRARDGVFFTSAEDYGGARAKKPSRFLIELGFEKKPGAEEADMADQLQPPASKQQEIRELDMLQQAIPGKSSYTQVRAFTTCPKQFKYAHILRVPVEGRHTFSFGKSIHNTLFQFFKLIQEKGSSQQENLFGNVASKRDTKRASTIKPSLDDLLKLYDQNFIDDWYLSKQHMEEYYAKGKQSLVEFYEAHKDNWPIPLYLEQPFNIKLAKSVFKGVIDRIDPAGKDKEVEIIDYKTGKMPKSGKLAANDKEQLLIYDYAARHVLQLKPVLLSYYYVEKNKKLSFTAEEKHLEQVKNNLEEVVAKIRVSDFSATPGFWCNSCDFRDICEDRWKG